MNPNSASDWQSPRAAEKFREPTLPVESRHSAPRFRVTYFISIDECVDRSECLDIEADVVAIDLQPLSPSLEGGRIGGRRTSARNLAVLRENAHCLLHGNSPPILVENHTDKNLRSR